MDGTPLNQLNNIASNLMQLDSLQRENAALRAQHALHSRPHDDVMLPIKILSKTRPEDQIHEGE